MSAKVMSNKVNKLEQAMAVYSAIVTAEGPSTYKALCAWAEVNDCKAEIREFERRSLPVAARGGFFKMFGHDVYNETQYAPTVTSTDIVNACDNARKATDEAIKAWRTALKMAQAMHKQQAPRSQGEIDWRNEATCCEGRIKHHERNARFYADEVARFK